MPLLITWFVNIISVTVYIKQGTFIWGAVVL